ncbi:hypothetical protein [Sphingobacterium mizutaii]|uniref:hypothetical protein n=2 Tax=Sphingobacteriaceae TaxID=84566 RepID=UPI00162555EA|nr:hypothetical protein [Sphingobacterium mizutaii]
MMRNQFILVCLKSMLDGIFDYYDISLTKVDTRLHAEESWPIGTDVYVVCGIYASQIYVQRLYIVREATENMIKLQIEKLAVRLKTEISKSNNQLSQG